MEITGSEGTIHLVEDSITVWDFKHARPEDAEILKQYGETHEGGGVADPAAMTHHNHKKNIASFLGAIETKQSFDIDGEESRKAVEIICAIYESQENQKVIHL